MSQFLIYSKKHSRGIATWWRPNSQGYTYDIKQAGRYSEEEAKKICEPSRGDSIMLTVEDAERLRTDHQVDMGSYRNSETFEEITGQAP